MYTEIENKFRRYRRIIKKIYDAGMGGIFEKYLLSPEAIENFFKSAKKIDFGKIELYRKLALNPKPYTTIHRVENPQAQIPQYDEFGKKSLKDGLWCVITLAGGSATRFFSESEEKLSIKSKGLFQITKNHSFMEIFAGEIISKAIIYGKVPVWIVLVSEITYDEVESFLRNFWFPSEHILILKQGCLPRFDSEGLPIISKDGNMILTGDGHGGVFFALLRKSESGESYKQILKSRGIKFAVLHNVDNILSRPLDEKRLDFHIRKNALFTISCVKRKNITERVGIPLYLVDENKISVMEYSVADPKIFSAVKEDGSPYFDLAHINVNLFSLDVVSRRYLKYLRPVIYTGKIVEVDGRRVDSTTIEYLNQAIVEWLPPSKVAICLLEREEFYSPTKSIKGEDSAEESRNRYLKYTKRRLERFGLYIPQNSYFEIAPYILFADEFISKIFDFSGWIIEDETEFYFGIFSPLDSYPIFSGDFRLLKGSSFIVRTNYPFGDIVLSGFDRRSFHCENPPRVKIGRGVLVKPGAKFYAELEKGSTLVIPQNFVIDDDIKIYVRSGEKVFL